ncbi:MAG: AlwI family type II restriction endonuclease [bacterium]|nr:AlwI family type II restriction endonuclease [bacterium]
MLKAWSITTTVRNPERLRDFLIALKPLVNQEWDNNNQKNYQKLLIKYRLYGYGNQQFYSGLPTEIVKLINNIDSEISDEIVDKIIEVKNYKDFAMRGRQSINPLTKFGFALIDDGILRITDLGQKLIESEKDSGDAFLKSFIKWQIPNPANKDFPENEKYNIVPFVATLKLIDEVNKIETARNQNAKGLSKREFSLFAPSLIDFNDIEKYAEEIVNLRDSQVDKTKQERKEIRDRYRFKFARSFLDTTDQIEIDKFLKNLKDYGDNAIRYFRLTKFIRIRGGGFYVDLEPNRHIEISSLFENEFYKPKAFADKSDYLQYMSDDTLPQLPWLTKKKLTDIVNNIYEEIVSLENELNKGIAPQEDVTNYNENQLVIYIENLRNYRKDLQEQDNHIKSQPVEAINGCISQLDKIFELENRPLMLEYLSSMGLHALNDAREIKPNYPVGDDNEPTSTASGGLADIECYYSDFNMICEVTMLNSRDQWFNEGQPVMRHLRDFENQNTNAHCLFIAPTIHTDTAETFWIANIHGYKGSTQSIAPITIKQFIGLLKTLKTLRESGKNFTHDNLLKLVKTISNSASVKADSDNWVNNIQNIINAWSVELMR